MPRSTAAVLLLFGLPVAAHGQGTAADYARAAGLPAAAANKVTRDKVDPHWFAGGTRFWYRNDLAGGATEFVVVDPAAGTRTVVPEADLPKPDRVPAPVRPGGPRRTAGGYDDRSPDGRWVAFVRGHDLYLRDVKTEGETRLTRDGTPADGYDGRVLWSPDSKKLAAIRATSGGDRRVTLVESSPPGRVQPRTEAHHYLKPGDPVPQPKPHLFDVAARAEIPVPDDLFRNPWDISHEHWSADSGRFLFFYNQRGHQVARVVAVDAATGAAAAPVNEECRTFFDYADKLFLRYLDATGELLWMSERDGWNHLYLVDAKSGRATPVTRGPWAVRGVDRVDEEAREIWFRAVGLAPGQDPYHVHHCRVKFDGTGFTRLTAGDGTHDLRFSPDRAYYLDTYSRVDLPPVTELRRGSDGTLVCGLEKADWAALRATGWRPPERFAAKGRDGATDIWGLIYRPTAFDPGKKYPVVEEIYAGPQDHHVPKRFRPFHGTPQAVAELGFVVVRIDGMGTNWRSKAFHDVCWKNLGDGGFPDRIRWIRAAAADRPGLDLSRGVGIYGGSAGGQNAVRGMTEYPDFYTVGVADCGCHDNRMDKVWWNELWMGWPVGPHYAAQSNVTNAHKLTGKLLLVVGELDRNVDPSSTLQVAAALIRADKDFDLLVIPGAGHGAAETPYGRRRRADFLVRHLLGVEPRAAGPATPRPAGPPTPPT